MMGQPGLFDLSDRYAGLSAAGEVSNYTAVEPLMALPLRKPKSLLANTGYDGGHFRENLLIYGILPIFPPRSNRKEPEHSDCCCHRDRNCVERLLLLSNSVISQPATTSLSYPARAYSTQPPHAHGWSILSTRAGSDIRHLSA